MFLQDWSSRGDARCIGKPVFYLRVVGGVLRTCYMYSGIATMKGHLMKIKVNCASLLFWFRNNMMIAYRKCILSDQMLIFHSHNDLISRRKEGIKER